jgi:phospholipid/cholesterol/gamma-HCH transport system substrate-binding protein
VTTSKPQRVRVALFAIASGVLLALVLMVFAGLHFWKDQTSFHMVFDRSVFGLERGADVFFHGVRVGTVDNISIVSKNVNLVRVDITVDASTPITTDVKAVLQLAGITGLKVIDLREGTSKAPRLAANMQIPVGETLLDELEEKGRQIVDQTAQLMERANAIAVQADMVIANLTELTDPTHMGALVEQTKAAAENLAAASAALKGLVDDNRAGLKASVAAIETAAKRTAELVDNGQLRSAVSDLRQASRTLKELARDVRQKPSRLLFSNPAPDRKLP